ncbi:hypothetical protein MLD38_020762 [Melastoma candidum]|uniref:Uncharacterized protein n=1 Tax=Melastoma candidum TaxID=119954 RepID=A0ACB9QE09_9MYRT|nr:hypothetical protein MLD38_020762 [Melastoma candidum]
MMMLRQMRAQRRKDRLIVISQDETEYLSLTSQEEKSGRKRNSNGMNLTGGDSKSEDKIPETGIAVDSPINGKLQPVATNIENLSPLGKLGNVQEAEEGKKSMSETKDNDPRPSDNTENLISRLNDSGSLPGTNEVEGEAYQRNIKKSAQLHQLLDSKPRMDAVAAG